MGFFRESYKILISLILIAFLAFLIWWSENGSFKFEGFGLNLFTEVIGVLITVVIIDRLNKQREDEKSVLPRFLAYKKINILLSNYIWFWRRLYTVSVPTTEPIDIRSFFSASGVNLIWNHLDLDSYPQNLENLNHFPMEIRPYLFSGPYWDYIPNELAKTVKSVKEIINEFGSYLEPEIYGKLYDLIDSNSFRAISDLTLNKIHYNSRDDLPEHFDKRALLICWAGKSSLPNESDHQTVLFLYKWCSQKYTYWRWKKNFKELDNVIYQNFKFSKWNSNKDVNMPIHMISHTNVHGKVLPCL